MMTKILLIDDDLLVRRSLSRILQSAGYEVATATNGNSGLAIFRSEHPDIVITDIIMPDQDGIGTILQIRQENPAVKIVAISGGGRHLGTDMLNAARKLGADEILAKPFDAEELLQAIGHPNLSSEKKEIAPKI